MKKIIYLAMALLFLNSPAFAVVKARVKVGSVTGKGETVVATVQGDFINLSLAVVGKKGSATVTALLPANFSKEKDSYIELFSLVGETAEANPAEIALGFTSTRTKGENSVAISAAENTVVTGKLKVISFDTATSVLKFVLRAKATPFTQVETTAEGSETTTSTKNLVIKAQGIVTLP